LEIFANGGAELRIGDVMCRPGDRGLEAAAHLVLTLGAGLEALDAPLDTELDTLVIAGLEVQAVVVGRRAPVASEERLCAGEKDRLPDYGAPAQGELDHQGPGHAARGLAEERARQVRLVAVSQEGIAVESVDAIEQGLIELPAQARLEVDPGLRDPPP